MSNPLYDALEKRAEAIQQAYKPPWWQWRRRRRYRLTTNELIRVMLGVFDD